MTDQSNYTPHDILGFGHRAETEGRYAYAHQIYSHLAHYYAHENVGEAARAGLARIGATGQGQPMEAMASGGQPVASARPHQQPPSQGHVVPPGSQRAPASMPSGNVPQTRPQSMPSTPTESSYRSSDSYRDDGFDGDELADVRLSFRSGIFTMRLAQVLGWLAMITGVIAMVMEIVGVGSASAVTSDTVRQVATGWFAFLLPVGLVVSGIVLVLVSQIARASFEAANSARQLLVLERSRSGI